MKKFIVFLQILSVSFWATACGSSTSNNTAGPGQRVCEQISDTPTEAYKRLYAAVKSKDTARIKAEMSKKSQEFVESLAMRQKNPVEKVYENGLTGTTFSLTLPEMRDERIGSCWAALEVMNTKDKRWEDLPFVNEDGVWKFAVGELFSGVFQSPGKGTYQKEQEAANLARGNTPPVNMMANVNSSVNANAPKYDGPQVEPLPKKK